MILDTYEFLQVENKYFQYWEDAADFVVNKIFNFSDSLGNYYISECLEIVVEHLNNNPYMIDYNFITTDQVSLLKSIVDFYLDSKIWMYDPSHLRGISPTHTVENAVNIHQSLFLLISHCSITLHQSSLNSEISRKELVDVVIKKQKDYGPNNISKFGVWGLIVRIHDKIARIDNLLSKGNNFSNAVNNETVYDTMLDIIGYSSVMLLWLNDWFLLPMRRENV